MFAQRILNGEFHPNRMIAVDGQMKVESSQTAGKI